MESTKALRAGQGAFGHLISLEICEASGFNTLFESTYRLLLAAIQGELEGRSTQGERLLKVPPIFLAGFRCHLVPDT